MAHAAPLKLPSLEDTEAEVKGQHVGNFPPLGNDKKIRVILETILDRINNSYFKGVLKTYPISSREYGEISQMAATINKVPAPPRAGPSKRLLDSLQVL